MNPATKGLLLVAIPYLSISYVAVQWSQPATPTAKAQEVVVAQEKAPETHVEAKKPLTIDQMIDNTFGDQAANAKRVVACESGFRANVVSKTHDYGLFQINWKAQGYRATSREALLDPDTNIRIAKQIYNDNGWGAWYMSKSCHHLK